MASEVLKVSHTAGVTNSESVLINGVNGHTYTILSITVCETAGAAETFDLYIDDGGTGTDYEIYSDQALGANQTFEHTGRIVLTDEDHRLGHENSCHKITADKAERIGKALLDNIKDAEAKEAEYIKDTKPRRKFNELCDKAADCLYDEVVDKSDGLITCPGDMKIHDPANYKRWSTLSHFGGGVQFSETSYPFSAANVKEFAEFCLNSGGFEIG